MSTDLPRTAQVGGTSRAANVWPVLLCWVAVALDGYDLVVLGVVIPTLLESEALGFTGPTITTASTLGLVGMGIGAVVVGPLTDRFGRRQVLITSVAVFSLLTIATGLAQSVGQFTAFRFLAFDLNVTDRTRASPSGAGRLAFFAFGRPRFFGAGGVFSIARTALSKLPEVGGTVV